MLHAGQPKTTRYVSDVLEDTKDIADEVLEEAKEVKETLKETTEKED